MAHGFKSVKLNHIKIELIYDDCDSEIVLASKFLVIHIPSNQFAGPKSVSAYVVFNLFL